jgi:hypothetical protein
MEEHRLQREGKNEPAITSIVMLPSLIIEKPCAAVADLSPAKRAAVIECFNNRGLYKCNGYWCGSRKASTFQVLLADLARDGVFNCNQKPPTRFSAIDRTRPIVCKDADRGSKLKRMVPE